jgi:glycosyltransferase involved in cell wall biosynthesis
MTNLVSILIPAYNAEKWLGDTIRSALSQTWPKKEIIIVDDGSSDNTLAIARQFESGSVKVITQENRGASAARNRAFSLAQGDYIQWLDADDLLAPGKITEQLKDRENCNHRKTLLSSTFGTCFYNIHKAKFNPTLLWQDLRPVEWIVNKFKGNLWMSPAVWLVSRELTDLAGHWDERLSLDDDGEYFCRVVAASEFIRFILAGKSFYRMVNLTSISRDTSDKACKSQFLSISLSFERLRYLEDSQRTRSACLNHLQRWYEYFYPENHELIIKANDLAHELGGKISPPEINWKYSPIMKIFGWRTAKVIMNNWRNVKLRTQQKWDIFLYNKTSKKKLIL